MSACVCSITSTEIANTPLFSPSGVRRRRKAQDFDARKGNSRRMPSLTTDERNMNIDKLQQLRSNYMFISIRYTRNVINEQTERTYSFTFAYNFLRKLVGEAYIHSCIIRRIYLGLCTSIQYLPDKFHIMDETGFTETIYQLYICARRRAWLHFEETSALKDTVVSQLLLVTQVATFSSLVIERIWRSILKDKSAHTLPSLRTRSVYSWRIQVFSLFSTMLFHQLLSLLEQ